MPPATDPLARYSPTLLALFRLYLRYYTWRSFSAVRLAQNTAPPPFPNRPLIIYCNHPSWWDPALLLLALPGLIRRRGYGPMDATELQRYALFQRMGLFGVEPATPRGAAAFLRTATEILTQPDTCLVITAEGTFTDPRLRPIRLRPGIAHLARRLPNAVILPLALEYSFWNESKPEALLCFGPPVQPAAETGAPPTLAQWQHALEAALAQTMDQLAAASITRNPANFTRLFTGTAGIGGPYDAWRRARAYAAGRPFTPRHEPGPR